MIRRLNYTNRKRIGLDRISIALGHEEMPPLTFSAEVDFEGLDLPADAAVVVEAYRRTSYMRFFFGTVGSFLVPSNRKLTNIDSGDTFYFRVKVIDETSDLGLILAQADQIAVEVDKTKRSLLPVEAVSLGQLVWKIEFEAERPVLQVNKDIPGMVDRVESDPVFASLVLPDVLRQILSKMVHDQMPIEDDESWAGKWAACAAELRGEDFPSVGEADEALEWIDGCVDAFASRHGLRSLFESSPYGG